MERVAGVPGVSFPEDTHRFFTFLPLGVCLSLKCAGDFVFLSAAFRKPLAAPSSWTGCLEAAMSEAVLPRGRSLSGERKRMLVQGVGARGGGDAGHTNTREGSGIQVGGLGDLEHTTSQLRPGMGATRQGLGTQCCAGGAQ